jgi:prevent-host-death family protein
VETVSISDFKARCLAILKRVKRTGRPVRVTRFGEAVADVVPPVAVEPGKPWVGSMAGTVEILGDIVEPVAAPEEWEALRR